MEDKPNKHYLIKGYQTVSNIQTKALRQPPMNEALCIN